MENSGDGDDSSSFQSLIFHIKSSPRNQIVETKKFMDSIYDKQNGEVFLPDPEL